jgi:hypothetical protein
MIQTAYVAETQSKPNGELLWRRVHTPVLHHHFFSFASAVEIIALNLRAPNHTGFRYQGVAGTM